MNGSSPSHDDSFEKKWRRTFERFAASHEDDAGIAGWSRNGLHARLEHFRQAWRGVPGGRWLEAGCGAGTYCRFLAERRQRVVGLDYSHISLKKAAARSTLPIDWLQGDVTRLPFGRNRFDGILCYGVMQALSSSEAAVRELATVLAPGGELWVDALNSRSLLHLAGKLVRRHNPVRFENPWRMQRLFRQAGLTDVRIDWVPIAPVRLARFQSWLESGFVRALLRGVPLLGMLTAHAFVVRGRRSRD